MLAFWVRVVLQPDNHEGIGLREEADVEVGVVVGEGRGDTFALGGSQLNS